MSSDPKFNQTIYNERPWYHDFSSLGIQTHFRKNEQEKNTYQKLKGFFSDYSIKFIVEKFASKPTHYIQKAAKAAMGRDLLLKPVNVNGGNQERKEKYILPYLKKVFQDCAQKGITKPSTLELFCADGYYSLWMQKNYNLETVKGVDLNERRIEQAKIMNTVLQSNVDFHYMDIYTIDPAERYDIVLCAGGLYHVHDPKKVLELCYDWSNEYVIVQTVITLESEDEDYFIAPAPGWQHGCRFTDAALKKWLDEIGFEILDNARDWLDNNAPLSSRGTTYYLCRKKNVAKK